MYPGATGDEERTLIPPRSPPLALPVANLFLTSDMQCPELVSSTSTPDSALPSLLNCAGMVHGFFGAPRGSEHPWELGDAAIGSWVLGYHHGRTPQGGSMGSQPCNEFGLVSALFFR